MKKMLLLEKMLLVKKVVLVVKTISLDIPPSLSLNIPPAISLRQVQVHSVQFYIGRGNPVCTSLLAIRYSTSYNQSIQK